MTKVACVGDSITWGFTILNPGKYGYPAVLQELLGEGFEVRNFGFNDASVRFDADTPYVTKKVYRDSLAWEPDIVLLMLGPTTPRPGTGIRACSGRITGACSTPTSRCLRIRASCSWRRSAFSAFPSFPPCS